MYIHTYIYYAALCQLHVWKPKTPTKRKFPAISCCILRDFTEEVAEKIPINKKPMSFAFHPFS